MASPSASPAQKKPPASAVQTVDLTGLSSDEDSVDPDFQTTKARAVKDKVEKKFDPLRLNQNAAAHAANAATSNGDIGNVHSTSSSTAAPKIKTPTPTPQPASTTSPAMGRRSVGLTQPNDPPSTRSAASTASARFELDTRTSRPDVAVKQTPPPPAHSTRLRTSPKNRTPKSAEWNSNKIEASLIKFSEGVALDHSRLVQYSLEEAEDQIAPPPWKPSPIDVFDNVKPVLADATTPRGDVMKVKLKQHGRENARGKQEQRQASYRVVSLKSNHLRVPVPKYRFHHVQISKNILSPNTPLKFIPHLKDLQEGDDTKKFNQWIVELESMDEQVGFDTNTRNDKAAKTRIAENARILSLYLERWLKRLAIPDCSKADLIRHMASRSENDDAITPQQKTSILSSYSDNVGSPRAAKMAGMFTTAFNRVFAKKNVTLDDVLMCDESVENVVVEPKKVSKDATEKPAAIGGTQLAEQVQQDLATYTLLGCLICHAHSCEHGWFDEENNRRVFSIDTDVGTKGDPSKIARMVNQKRVAQAKANSETTVQQRNGTSPRKHQTQAVKSCRQMCYLTHGTGGPSWTSAEWSASEIAVLQDLFLTMGDSSIPVPCAACLFLGRKCWEVQKQIKKMKLALPELEMPKSAPPVKGVPWYDRFKKQLIGDWQEHTVTQDFSVRDDRDICLHDGPCTAANGCPCVESKVLCDSFCRCTKECCAYKFTGCACHASGKTCQARQKETGKPCICILLNRECDPMLCVGCGAKERADPQNAEDFALHATGCQNVALQRGLSKKVLIGQSQLEGCGYGLFTAEDISPDEFVIEYVGELITHDEGVRREARRGDVFNMEANSSYLFTLLEEYGLWVDAAIYGNLSRYINHASEHDKRGCNITPRILYVNGEFRIRFSAMRDIKAGEELFFNYGENFPNLTKKLLEDKAEDVDGEAQIDGAPGPKKKGGRRPGAGRKPNTSQSSAAPRGRGGRGRGRGGRGSRGGRGGKQPGAGARKEAPSVPTPATWDGAGDEDEDDEKDNVYQPGESDELDPDPLPVFKNRKRKRVFGEDDSEEDEDFRPTRRRRAPGRGGVRGGRGSRGGRGGRGSRGGRGGGRGGLHQDAEIPESDIEEEQPQPNRRALITMPLPHTPLKNQRGAKGRRNADGEGDVFMEDKFVFNGDPDPEPEPSIGSATRSRTRANDAAASRSGSRGKDDDEGSSGLLDSRDRKRQKPARYLD